VGQPREAIVYGLRGIGDSNVRYIGVTTNSLRKRLTDHKSSARTQGFNYPLHKWMRDCNFNVEIFEIETIDSEIRFDREMYWISEMRKNGHTLLNITDGGSGTTGWKMPEEVREKLSRRAKGRPSAFKGRHHSAESKLNLSIAAKKYPRGELSRASKISESDVLEIRRLRESGIPAPTIAKKFGIGASQVYRIEKREKWGWL